MSAHLGPPLRDDFTPRQSIEWMADVKDAVATSHENLARSLKGPAVAELLELAREARAEATALRRRVESWP